MSSASAMAVEHTGGVNDNDSSSRKYTIRYFWEDRTLMGPNDSADH